MFIVHVEITGIPGEADLVTNDFKMAWAYYTITVETHRWALTDGTSSVKWKCWLETKKE